MFTKFFRHRRTLSSLRITSHGLPEPQLTSLLAALHNATSVLGNLVLSRQPLRTRN